MIDARALGFQPRGPFTVQPAGQNGFFTPGQGGYPQQGYPQSGGQFGGQLGGRRVLAQLGIGQSGVSANVPNPPQPDAADIQGSSQYQGLVTGGVIAAGPNVFTVTTNTPMRAFRFWVNDPAGVVTQLSGLTVNGKTVPLGPSGQVATNMSMEYSAANPQPPGFLGYDVTGSDIPQNSVLVFTLVGTGAGTADINAIVYS